MQVMMMTPKVDLDDDIFGFTNEWINKFAEKLDKLYVVTLNSGRTKLRDNLQLFSLDRAENRLSKMILLNKYLSKIVPKVDVTFTHMFPEFPILVAPYAKVFGKPLVMFHEHGHVDLKLKISHFLADRIVAASKRGFRIESDKITVVGHGIDAKKFRPSESEEERFVLSVGRISPVKDLETLVKAASFLDERVKVKIVGGPRGKKDRSYLGRLKKSAEEFEGASVEFVGRVPYRDILEYYQKSRVFINTSHTGSLDKVVLEAMACGKPVVTCNDAFLDIFTEEMKEKCFFEKGDYRELSRKIEHFLNSKENLFRKELRSLVEQNHSIENLASRIGGVWKEVSRV